MDGFFVAKLHVGKRPKNQAVAEAVNEPVLTGIVDDEGRAGKVKEQQEVKFNDEEDEKIMDAIRRKRLKAKGIRVAPKKPA